MSNSVHNCVPYLLVKMLFYIISAYIGRVAPEVKLWRHNRNAQQKW